MVVVTVRRADKKIALVSSDSDTDTVSIINERKIKRTNQEEREDDQQQKLMPMMPATLICSCNANGC